MQGHVGKHQAWSQGRESLGPNLSWGLRGKGKAGAEETDFLENWLV